MESKHTPGPWTADGECINSKAHFGFTVADVSTFTGNSTCPKDEREANARLIAAAPDMLEALEAVMKRGSWKWTGDYDQVNITMSKDDFQKTCAAIAKAQGK